MKTKTVTLITVATLVLGSAAVQGCRRNADDKGVGTSSVGAGGANGAAPNNTGKAEPVKGTEKGAQGTPDATDPNRPPPAAGGSSDR